jgi:IclR family acetate operon transcriptional repressor
VSRPFLARLVDLSGETANLAVLEGDHVVYVAQVPSAHRLRLFAEVGRHVPAHSTAVGKVLLGGLDELDAAEVLRRAGLPRRTPRTLTSAAAVLAAARTAAAAGFAVDDEEEETGVRCLAVPVLDGDRVVAAMSVSGPSTRVPSTPTTELVDGLRGVAAEFAAAVSPAR